MNPKTVDKISAHKKGIQIKVEKKLFSNFKEFKV